MDAAPLLGVPLRLRAHAEVQVCLRALRRPFARAVVG